MCQLFYLQASCNPVAYSLLADFFPPQHRAFALSVYHYGVYLGKTTVCTAVVLSLTAHHVLSIWPLCF